MRLCNFYPHKFNFYAHIVREILTFARIFRALLSFPINLRIQLSFNYHHHYYYNYYYWVLVKLKTSLNIFHGQLQKALYSLY